MRLWIFLGFRWEDRESSRDLLQGFTECALGQGEPQTGFNTRSSPSAPFEIPPEKNVLSLFSRRACLRMYICIFANGYCVYGVHVRSGCVHGRSAVVPRALTGVCRCDDGERTPTETAYRRTGHTPGGVNTHRVCTSLYSSQKWTWCVTVFSQ